jgi:hypothetical protein
MVQCGELKLVALEDPLILPLSVMIFLSSAKWRHSSESQNMPRRTKGANQGQLAVRLRLSLDGKLVLVSVCIIPQV